MSDLFADRLLDAIARKGSPICVGIDPMIEMFADSIKPKNLNDAEVCIDAIFDFTVRVLEVIAPHVPIVKFQSAYFEKYFHEGVEAYYSLIHQAHELGLLTIGDVKRGDIGSTSQAYADGHLANPSYDEMEDFITPDAITINPFLGIDSIEPFVKTAMNFDKGLFVLVRTSNPGSGDFQDAKLADGRTFSEMLADKLANVASQPALMGDAGWSSLGAVVGATQPHTMHSLRERLPKSIFLLPGYGTQGATADMTKSAFKNGKGAIVSASRSILYAHRDKKYESLAAQGWEQCVEAAVKDMKADLQHMIAL